MLSPAFAFNSSAMRAMREESTPATSALPPLIALYNAADYIDAEDTIINIEFDRELTDNNVHVEYELIAQDKADAFLSNNLYRKLQDSFCGYNLNGLPVPNPILSPPEKYGVDFQPRQSMFADRFTALKNYLDLGKENPEDTTE